MDRAPGAVPPTGAMRVTTRATDLALWLAVRPRRRAPVTAVEPVDRAVHVVVRRVRRPCPDVAELELAAAAGGPLPAWRPGAHVDLTLPSGQVRQYSLCGDPADRSVYVVAVRRLTGASREVHDLSPGAELTLRGPRNAFPFAAAGAYLFLAGGIGITPIAPMVRAAHASGTPWRLVHTGRDRASMPLSAELSRLAPGRVRRRADDEHDGPPTASELLGDLPPGCAVYCCGPPPMIASVRAAVPDGVRFHSERFSPPPIVGGRPFTVRIDGGPDVAVPADRSALDAVRAVRPDVGWSCRQGFCGTCHVPLRDGATVGDPAGPGWTALCVARAAGDRIVVDLGP